MKKIPRFKSENEERAFWATHDATEFVDFSHAKLVSFPEPQTESLSLDSADDVSQTIAETSAPGFL